MKCTFKTAIITPILNSNHKNKIISVGETLIDIENKDMLRVISKQTETYKYRMIKNTKRIHSAFQSRCPNDILSSAASASSISHHQPLHRQDTSSWNRKAKNGPALTSVVSVLDNHLRNTLASQGLATNKLLALQTCQSVEKGCNKENHGGGD
jgi:hypothetical protein